VVSRSRSQPLSRAVLTLVIATLLAPVAFGSPARAQSPQDMQWYLRTLNIATAQRLATGRGVTVAVVDTGVDGRNPDFGQRALSGKTVDPSAQNTDPLTDTDGHGTLVAGIIGAGGADGTPLGVAPGATIMSVRTGNDRYTVALGIEYAAEHGAKVINVSWGADGLAGGEMMKALQDAFRHDAVVVAGVGNADQGFNEVAVPANVPGVLAVTGTDQSASFWPGSVQGPEAVLAAPAKGIVSVASRQTNYGSYAEGDGTSCSTAIVSGVAALVRSKYPSMSAANVINLLIRTADDKGAAGRDPQYGFGLVDPLKALTTTLPPISQNPLTNRSASAAPSPVGSHPVHAGGRPGTGAPLWLIVGVLAAVVVVVVLLLAVLGWRRRVSGSRFEAERPGPSGWRREV
jgi:membrane-anchored mycosin MYCP